MNSAGIILPLMIFGAILGGLFGVLFYPEHPELFVLLGIAAVLGASLNNPITAILLIIELTWAPFLLFPAAITTIVAYIFSGPSAIVPGQKNVWIEKENG
jgi:H+/Cl- antiporter ClcA